MKPMGAGVILKSNTVTPRECLHYTMSLPVSVVITGFQTMEILKETIESARCYTPMTEERCAAILAKTALAAAEGKFERYKTEGVHDGTIHNPQFLGEE